MTADRILDGLKFWLENGAELIWTVLAWTLDCLYRIDAAKSGGFVLAFSVIAAVQAMGLQKRLAGEIIGRPRTTVSLWRLDWRSSLPVALFLPFVWLFKLIRAISVWVWNRLAKKEKPSKAAPSIEPHVVATLGPSYVVASGILASIFVVGWITEPLLAAQLDLSPGAPAWQVLFLGNRPELAFHLPLDHRPYAAIVVLTFYWLTLWTWIGRFVRLFWQSDLGRNLARDRLNPAILQVWRESFAVRRLVGPADAYRDWARWLVASAAPLLVWAWLSLGNEIYRVPPSLLAVAWIVWLSCFLHLSLRGVEKLESEEKTKATVATGRGPGWEAVLADLRARLQVGEAVAADFPRRVAQLEPRHDPNGEKLFSPLLPEVMEGLPGLTTMQIEVLRKLARDGHVHTEAPAAPGELVLGSRLESHDREDVERRRNRIVLAPEGGGKTTLAMLAACNHALVHTRSTIFIVRGENEAKSLHEAFRQRLDCSTARWNLRVRRIDEDLVNDLTRGILPDVVITDLHGLVVPLLDGVDHYRDFLRTVGLIIVDDAELFAGPVEIHAQLALRRLKLVFRELLDVEQLGEESAPIFLILGADAMHQTATWIKDLCGIEAEVLPFLEGSRDSKDADSQGEEAEAQEPGKESDDRKPGRESKIKSGPHHRFYRLADFTTPYGEQIDLRDIVESCERVGVAWSFRRCGDDRRHLGLEILNLPERPEHFTTADRAGVVILEGQWSEVRREIRRLRYAGRRFNRPEGEAVGRRVADGAEETGPEPIAFITVVDPDEDMALTTRDRHAEIFRSIDELPHPVLRPPTGRVVQSHLATDLVQRWLEVKDLIDVFGHDVRSCLKQLAHQDLLLAEKRVDVRRFAFEYQDKLFVRALARAVMDDAREDENPLLPPRVAQVELASKRLVRLVDRTTQIPLRTIDADSAYLAFYPGRLFDGENERYVVVGPGKRAEETTDESPSTKVEGADVQGDLYVEPTLVRDLSSPRRRVHLLGRDSELGPDPVHIGSLPLAIEIARVELRTEHFATLRVNPVDGAIHQRHVYEDASRRQFAETRLSTLGLLVYPNPRLTEDQQVVASHQPLRLEAARLIAAAMRLVLPSLYRGAREGLGVEIQLRNGDQKSDHELEPGEGFILFDCHSEGNGIARAIHREGIQLLLRLVRLVLERVLSHGRLRALYDHWGDPAELRKVGEEKRGTAEERSAKRKAESRLRHEALAWLDQHLRPEGGPATQRSDDDYGSHSEPGEGDYFDLGRCWYTSTGSVGHLVWVKHRWRLDNQDEAALDVAFDRRTSEESRLFTESSEILDAYAALHQRQLADESARLDDGTVWGAPRPVWSLGEDEKPRNSGDVARDGTVQEYHRLASSVAAHFRPALETVACKLKDSALETGGGSAAVATYIARFVQGIPYSLPVALGRGLRPPVSTLLFRRGDCDSKSLLMALLLQHCGIEAGLFVSFAEEHAIVAAALPPGLPLAQRAVTAHRDAEGKFATEEDAVREERYLRDLKVAAQAWAGIKSWSEESHLPPPPIWADLPPSPGRDGDETCLFVPIESTVYSPVNGVRVRAPDSWAFLPLLLDDRIQWSDDPLAVDTAEYGEASK